MGRGWGTWGGGVGSTRGMWRGLLAAAALPLLGAAPKQEKPEFKKVPLDLLPTVEEKLVAASAYGDLAAVGELLAEGADPNAEPDYSASVAVRKEVIPPGSPLTAAVIGNQPRAIVALLEAGGEASAAPRRGSPGPSTSALGTAAVQNNPSLLKAFHKGGADLTTPLPEGFRPLHLVAWGMFVPKSGRARALGYLVEDEDGPRLDVNAAAVGPSEDWRPRPGEGGVQEGVLPASVPGSTALHEAAKKGNNGKRQSPGRVLHSPRFAIKEELFSGPQIPWLCCCAPVPTRSLQTPSGGCRCTTPLRLTWSTR